MDPGPALTEGPGVDDLQIVRGTRVITPDRELTPGWVAVRGDRIVEVGQGPAPAGRAARVDAVAAEGTRGDSELATVHAVLVPGFVDIHNHGGGGAAFTGGAEAALTVRDAHLQQGTTSVVASLVTDSIEALTEQVRALAPLVHSGELVGIHLEGPWLSEQWCGAHPPALLADPDPGAVAALTDAAGGALAMVTLAPERDGALAAIRALTQAGVRVGVGHTDATYAQTRAAIEAGASVATHLYNAQRAPHHREPGPSLALLEDPGVFIESIVDGHHLHPAVVRGTARTAGPRWVLVTDAMAAALLGDGSYQLGTLVVEVSSGVARLGPQTPGGQGPLAGSTLSLGQGVRTAVGCGVPLVDAIRAATLAPAQALGRSDIGRLAAGARADLVALSEDLAVQSVMHGGAWVATRAGSDGARG